MRHGGKRDASTEMKHNDCLERKCHNNMTSYQMFSYNFLFLLFLFTEPF